MIRLPMAKLLLQAHTKSELISYSYILLGSDISQLWLILILCGRSRIGWGKAHFFYKLIEE